MSLTSGLLHGYKLNGNSNDVKGTKNGADTSVTYTSGKIGLCSSYSGTNSYTSILAPIFKLSGIKSPIGSVSLWFNANNVGSGQKRIFADGGGYIYIAISDNSFGATGKLTVAIASGTYKTITYSTVLTTSTWYHVVLTWNSTNMKMYVNGVLIGTLSAGAIDDLTAYNYFIGAGNAANALPFSGLVDELYLFDYDISQSDVNLLYNSGNGITYPFSSGFFRKMLK
jgi:hypothetical protein